MALGRKTGGRSKGTPNKITKTVREAFEAAFEALQDEDGANLIEWAKRNPTEFYKLSSKLIPINLQAAGSLTLNIGTGVPDDNDASDLA